MIIASTPILIGWLINRADKLISDSASNINFYMERSGLCHIGFNDPDKFLQIHPLKTTVVDHCLTLLVDLMV